MTRTIVLDSFPLSCIGKHPSGTETLTDYFRLWVLECVAAGNSVIVPAIAYYETLRELERMKAPAQISRIRILFAVPERLLALEIQHLEVAAKLWGQVECRTAYRRLRSIGWRCDPRRASAKLGP